jgi:hypothetical protein
MYVAWGKNHGQRVNRNERSSANAQTYGVTQTAGPGPSQVTVAWPAR